MALSKEEVFEKMSRKGVVILNILPAENFRKLHISGSSSFPIKKDMVEFCREAAEKYGKDKHFIVYGERLGMLDSYLATSALLAEGFRVENYPGGLLDWHRAGMPVKGTETEGSPVAPAPPDRNIL